MSYLKNYLKQEVETEYRGTKIILDYLYIVQTVVLVIMALLLFTEREVYLGIAVLLVAALPYAHEGGHYYIAREHGFKVSELRFVGIGAECKIDGTLTHKDTMEICLAGELMTGVCFLGAFYMLLLYGQSVNSPFTVLTAIIPCMWVLSWLHNESDMLIALKAHHNMRSQERKD